MRPIVFLGLYGVVISRTHLGEVTERFEGRTVFSPQGPSPFDLIESKLVERLNPLVGKVDFILSGGWYPRLDEHETGRLLRLRGWTGEFAGVTPRKMSSYKCNEIHWYLRDNPEHAAMGHVVLDQESHSRPHYKTFVEVVTDPIVGVTEAEVQKVAGLLGVKL